MLHSFLEYEIAYLSILRKWRTCFGSEKCSQKPRMEMRNPLQVNCFQKFLLKPRISMCAHTWMQSSAFLVLFFKVLWDWLDLGEKKYQQISFLQNPQFLWAYQGELSNQHLSHFLLPWQASQVSLWDWTDGEAACPRELPRHLPGWKSPLSKWLFLCHWTKHNQTQTSVLPHHHPDHKVALSTAALALSVLPGCVNSLVLFLGHPMSPTFHPSAPSYPFQFLIVSHLQLPILLAILFPAAVSPPGRFGGFGRHWSSSMPWEWTGKDPGTAVI